ALIYQALEQRAAARRRPAGAAELLLQARAVGRPTLPLPPALLAALDGQRWHVSGVAEQLGISRNTLYRKLRRHGLVRGQA
ncbi:helix-turn-helix domain-containing protein, partial [Pseudomonas aeruginosa]|uniref:helix-turn-helix domain-containing protein n=1 Tax=Pseudomonas aeruginosa TaxID=287 RepID=UPI0027E5675D